MDYTCIIFMDSTNYGSEIIRKKKCICIEHVQTFIVIISKTTHCFSCLLICTIYIVLGITSNLEMISVIPKDACSLYVNTIPFNMRDLSTQST